MTIQYSGSVRNAQLDALESTIGTAPLLTLRTGAQPANCAAGASGTLLCTITLPSDWLAAASGGAKAKSGTWSGTAGASGTAAHFRVMDSSNTTCHIQGSVGLGSGDISLDNNVLASGQTVTMSSFTINDNNP